MSEVIQFPRKNRAPLKQGEHEVRSEWKVIVREDGTLYAVYTGAPIEDENGFETLSLLTKASEALGALIVTIEELNAGIKGDLNE